MKPSFAQPKNISEDQTSNPIFLDALASLESVRRVSDWGVTNFFVKYWIKGFQTSDLKLQDLELSKEGGGPLNNL